MRVEKRNGDRIDMKREHSKVEMRLSFFETRNPKLLNGLPRSRFQESRNSRNGAAVRKNSRSAPIRRQKLGFLDQQVQVAKEREAENMRVR